MFKSMMKTAFVAVIAVTSAISIAEARGGGGGGGGNGGGGGSGGDGSPMITAPSYNVLPTGPMQPAHINVPSNSMSRNLGRQGTIILTPETGLQQTPTVGRTPKPNDPGVNAGRRRPAHMADMCAETGLGFYACGKR